jgi:anti-sigma B factor antagonist
MAYSGYPGIYGNQGRAASDGPARLALRYCFSTETVELTLYMTHGNVKGVAVVWLIGRIVLGQETSALREKVKGLFDEGYKKLVLNMDRVTFIDSAGLGALVALNYNANSYGAALRLCHLGSRFRDLLFLTKLHTVFEVSDTQADALRSFSE